jgi:hypothetical protein
VLLPQEIVGDDGKDAAGAQGMIRVARMIGIVPEGEWQRMVGDVRTGIVGVYKSPRFHWS